jgi:hypothetical protein
VPLLGPGAADRSPRAGVAAGKRAGRFDGRREVARHERLIRRGGRALELDHYLELLTRKPGALAGSTPLAQAGARGLFTEAHQTFWERARAAHGDGPGTRALIEVLLLHRHAAHADVVAGVEAALAAGSLSPELVAIETRNAAGRRVGGISGGPSNVRALLSRPAAALPADPCPAPNLARYDALLSVEPPAEPAS